MHLNVMGNAPAAAAAAIKIAVVVVVLFSFLLSLFVDLEYGPSINVKHKPANFRLDFCC